MTNLTDKWKENKLPSGMYYIRTIQGTEKIAKNCFSVGFIDYTDLESVLDNVPSYEKYTKMVALLKECINMSKDGIFVPRYSFIDEIEKVLGEK